MTWEGGADSVQGGDHIYLFFAFKGAERRSASICVDLLLPPYLGRVSEEADPPVRAVPVRSQQGGVAVKRHAGPPGRLEVGQRAHDACHAHPEKVRLRRVREVLLDQRDGVERPRIVMEGSVIPDVCLPLLPSRAKG